MGKNVLKEGSLFINNQKHKISVTFHDVPESLVDEELINNICDKMELFVPGLTFSENYEGQDFSGMHCLIVDNNENETRRLVHVVSNLTINYALISENELVSFLEKNDYDIIFLSLNLDWRNSQFRSVTNCREYILRKFGAKVFVVLTTEYQLSEYERESFFEQGFNAILEKPVIIKKLLRLFKKVKN